MTLAKREDLLHRLRKLKKPRLWEIHNRVFSRGKGVNFPAKIPPWTAKAQLMERIYHLYCIEHPLDPEDTIEYTVHAERLTNLHSEGEEVYCRRVRNPSRFTKSYIMALEPWKVDCYLTVLGMPACFPAATSRQLLFDYFHGSVRLASGRRRNVFKALKRAILADPQLDYCEFYKKYKGVIPRVTHIQFRKAKTRLRSIGVPLPMLKPGRRLGSLNG